MNASHLPVNWFDLVTAGILTAGYVRGRKRGMSAELPGLIQMSLMLLIAGLFYKPASQMVQHFAKLPRLVTHLSSYIVILAATRGLLMVPMQRFGEKLTGRDSFGKLEFPLGAFSGMVRWSCGLLIVLSLLNAKLVTEQQNQARTALANEELGSDYFAIFNVGFLQHSIFKDSFIGSHIHEWLDPLLIEGSTMSRTPPKTDDSEKAE